MRRAVAQAAAMVALLALPALGPGGCASAPGPTHVGPDALLASIRAGEAPVVLDVRTRGEYERGHVPGAIHIPFLSVTGREDEIPGPRDEPVVVYCERGPRAGIARSALRWAGFTDVRYLEGHMKDWRQRGFPVERSPAAVR